MKEKTYRIKPIDWRQVGDRWQSWEFTVMRDYSDILRRDVPKWCYVSNDEDGRRSSFGYGSAQAAMEAAEKQWRNQLEMKLEEV